MRKAGSHLFAILTIFSFPFITQGYAEPTQPILPLQNNKNSEKPFSAFTGKITKNKVRMRLQPNLESPILREFAREDLIVVVGESDDFYAILPPKDIKSFIFRTFVLDNVIEGSRVNVRLEPNLDSPVIAQLNSGDHVEGVISPLNSKWMEIAPPQTARFYVSKEYVEKIGDPTMLETLTKKRDEVNRLLTSTSLISQTELQKPYPQININGIVDNLNKIIKQYPEFSTEVNKAKETLKTIQDSYLQKKIAYLEAKEQAAAEALNAKEAFQDHFSQIQEPLQEISQEPSPISAKMATWIPVEEALYKAWAEQNDKKSQEEFYSKENQDAVTLRGVVESYNRSVKNKPGDYLLVSQSSRLPIGYLYSTKLNLQDKVGQEVTIIAIPRPNNNFAFPAYFVLTAE